MLSWHHLAFDILCAMLTPPGLWCCMCPNDITGSQGVNIRFILNISFLFSFSSRREKCYEYIAPELFLLLMMSLFTFYRCLLSAVIFVVFVLLVSFVPYSYLNLPLTLPYLTVSLTLHFALPYLTLPLTLRFTLTLTLRFTLPYPLPYVLPYLTSYLTFCLTLCYILP